MTKLESSLNTGKDEANVSTWPMVRVHPEHYASLTELAEQQHRSINATLYLVLDEALYEEGVKE